MVEQLQILGNVLTNIAYQDSDTYFICIDGFENITIPNINKICPNRFIRCGISEANAVSVASGIALTGKCVFLIIVSKYASTRALEQIMIDVGYNNANVKIIALKGGIKYNADGGYSHWAIEDIATVRTIPNITILNPATNDELCHQVKFAHNTKGCFYIRVENLHSNFNPLMQLQNYKMPQINNGKDVAIIAEGSMVEYVCNLDIESIGLKPLILNASVIKPFDKENVINLINKNIPIITIEEQVRGGVGSIVSEIIAEYGKKVKFLPIRVDSESYNIVGKYNFVADKIIDLSNILVRIARFCTRRYSFFGFPIFVIQPNLSNGKCYLIFGMIPLISIRYRHATKKHKLTIKLYLFGSIRIL